MTFVSQQVSHSRNHRVFREKSKTRNEAPHAEVWINRKATVGQNITRPTALTGRENLYVPYEERFSYRASQGLEQTIPLNAYEGY